MLKHASSLLLCAAASLLLSSCSNPEQIKKERTETLEKFATQVAKQIFDRNPETVKESMIALTRDELTQATTDKLQAQGYIPKTDIGILKIQAEQEDAKATNVVNIESSTPLGPVEKPVVPMEVKGTIVNKAEGKADQTVPFSITLNCKFDSETGAVPQVVDVSVGGAAAQPKKSATEETQKGGRKKRKRKRH